MHYINTAIWYWSLWVYAAPYTPFRRNRVAIAYRYANFLPASHRNSRSAPYTSRSPTDSNGILVAHYLWTPLRLCLSTARGSGFSPSSPTAGVTLPRPPLRTFCPKNPTREKHSPLDSLTRRNASTHLLNFIKSIFYNFNFLHYE